MGAANVGPVNPRRQTPLPIVAIMTEPTSSPPAINPPAPVQPASATSAPTSSSAKPVMQRMLSIDAYRGLVMLLMMGEVVKLEATSKLVSASDRFSDSTKAIWEFLAHHQSHALWKGCSLHDMIQPSFSFLVGVALPFSIAARQSRGQSKAGMSLHA